MNLLQPSRGEGFQVDRYDTTTITIGARRFNRSLLLAPDRIDPDWGPDHPDRLTASQLESLLPLQPEVVLVGTGNERLALTTPTLLRVLTTLPGYEVMSTAAACRTYNLLLAEGRRVVAGLIVVAPHDSPARSIQTTPSRNSSR